MSNGEKPDGFMAWHESESEMREHVDYLTVDCAYASVVFPSFESALEELKSSHEEYFDEAEMGAGIVHWLQEKGWRIRAVKLTFLDEAEHE